MTSLVQDMINRVVDRISLLSIVLMGTISSITLLAWMLRVESLVVLIEEYPTMKANTALCFLLASIYLLNRRYHLHLGNGGLLVIIALISSVTLLEYVTGSYLFIDQMLVEDLISESFPGRMSIATSVGFLISTVLLYGIDRWSSKFPYSYDLIFAGYFSIAAIALVSYFFNPEDMFEVTIFDTLSLPTAICFSLLAIVIILNASAHSSLSLFTRSSASAQRFRLLAVFTLFIPLALGGVVLDMVSKGYFGNSFGLTLFATFFMFIVVVGLGYNAKREEEFDKKLLAERQQNLTLQKKLSSVIDVSNEAIILFTQTGQVIHCNRGASKLFGWSRDELQSMTLDQLIPGRLAENRNTHLMSFLKSNNKISMGRDPIRMMAEDKEGRRIPIIATVTKKYVGDELLLAITAKNAKKLHQTIQILGEKAYLDGLTNVYNRAALEIALAECTKGNKRRDDRCCVMMIDIDHFKSVNDDYGHDMGDRVLKKVVLAISKCLRSTEKLYRYGGEEFVILVQNIDEPAAKQFAERIRTTVRETPMAHQHDSIFVTCSIGYSFSDNNEQHLKEAIKRADQALYHAKQQGRDRVISSKVMEHLPIPV